LQHGITACPDGDCSISKILVRTVVLRGPVKCARMLRKSSIAPLSINDCSPNNAGSGDSSSTGAV